MKFMEELMEMGACSEAISWIGDKSSKEAWEKCHRPDWIVWICLRRLHVKGWPSFNELVLTLCDCLELYSNELGKYDEEFKFIIGDLSAVAYEEFEEEDLTKIWKFSDKINFKLLTDPHSGYNATPRIANLSRAFMYTCNSVFGYFKMQSDIQKFSLYTAMWCLYSASCYDDSKRDRLLEIVKSGLVLDNLQEDSNADRFTNI